MSPEANEPTAENLRTLSIEALQQAQPGLDEFQRAFRIAGDAFEQGEEAQGFQALQQIIPPLGEFATFCSNLRINCEPWLPAALAGDIDGQGQRFETCMQTMLKESQNGNYIALGDLLRDDFCELLDEYRSLFPRMAEALEQVGGKE